jgi:hypothetical protein
MDKNGRVRCSLRAEFADVDDARGGALEVFGHGDGLLVHVDERRPGRERPPAVRHQHARAASGRCVQPAEQLHRGIALVEEVGDEDHVFPRGGCRREVAGRKREAHTVGGGVQFGHAQRRRGRLAVAALSRRARIAARATLRAVRAA